MANHTHRHTLTHSRRLWRQRPHWLSTAQYRTVAALIAITALLTLVGSPMAAALNAPPTTPSETTFYIRPLPDTLRVKRRYPLLPSPQATQTTGSRPTHHAPKEQHLRVIPHKKSANASIYLDSHELIRLRATDTLPEPYTLALAITRKLYMASTSQPLTKETFATQAVDDGNTVILLNNQPLLLVDTAQAAAVNSDDDFTTHNLAKAWVTHLNKHFGIDKHAFDSQLANYQPTGFAQSGEASWYGPQFHGRRTANGERYDMYGMTAAHKTLPFGTLVQVTNHRTGKSTIVRINDRGPYAHGRIIDLSKSAAQEVGLLGSGVAPVSIKAITPSKQPQKPVGTVAFIAASQPVLPIHPAIELLPPEPAATTP